MLERKVVVRLNEGLHARPATQFVKLARSFAADIEVVRNGKSANAKSAVKLMLLGVKENDEILVRANGADEAAAVTSLCEYAGQSDTEAIDAPPNAPPAAAPAPENARAHLGSHLPRGIPASGGAAIGPAFVFMPEHIEAPRRLLAQEDVAGELRRLAEAREAVERELERRGGRAAPRSQEADIIAALAEIGRDEEFVRRMELQIVSGFDAVSASLDCRR